MAQTHTVAKSQKEHRCSACGQPIEVGQPYKWFKMKLARGGVKKSYHPGCNIPPSHRTTSRMGAIYDAQAALNLSGCETVEDVQSELQSFAETVREVAEGYAESADNIESGFQHETYQSQELREKSESLESWADELEQWEFSGDAEPVQDEEDVPDEEPESDDDYEARLDTWRDEVRDDAQNEVDNCPV
jgi:hypothetical protein